MHHGTAMPPLWSCGRVSTYERTGHCRYIPITQVTEPGVSFWGNLRYGLIASVDYCSFAYSALAAFRMGMSGSAPFHRVKNC